MTNLKQEFRRLAKAELNKREKARQNLLDFTSYTFPEFKPAEHHKLLASKLEEVEAKVRRGEGARLMVFMPPRHGKSELCSRRFPAWVLARNPNWEFISASYGQSLADEFGRDVRRIVGSYEFNALFPHIRLDPDVKAASTWNVINENNKSRRGLYRAVGVQGPVTGKGAQIAIIDDPLKGWELAQSETQKNKDWDWYITDLRTRLMPDPKFEVDPDNSILGGIIMPMTRWADDDLAGRLIEAMNSGGDQWEIIDLPALCDSENDPLGREIGEALWPQRYTKAVLEQTRSVTPTYQWSALYQQKPVPDEGDYFLKEWFKFYDKPPKYRNVYITHDDAVSESDGDFTEIAVWGVDENESIYALDWFTGQVTSDVWIDKLIDLIDTYKPFTVVGESGPIKKAIEPFLIKRMHQRKVYARLDWLPSVTDKQTRAIAFRGMASMGQVYFPRTDWARDVINQLIRFPSGVHDDKVDACSLMARILSHGAKAPKPKKDELQTIKESLAQKETYRDILKQDMNKPKVKKAL